MADGMTHHAGFKPAAATVSPLLHFLAGPHAPAIAAVWPAPHRDFFTLPAARRHAAAILLSRGDTNLADLHRAVERHRDGELAARLVGPSPPGGLMKALGRTGETLWTAPDYELFLDLFVDDNAGTVLRHMPEIAPVQLLAIGALPPRLRVASVVAFANGVQAARDLSHALDLVEAINGPQAQVKLARGIAKAKTTQALFEKAANGLTSATFAGPSGPPQLPPPFVAVTNQAELERIALEFKNCLRDFANDMVNGRMAVYVWRGHPNGAIALRWDPAGWRLAEAEAAANERLPDDALVQIVAELDAHNVRTGPSTWMLANRLRAHAYGNATTIGDTWQDRLELGELWD